MHVLFAFRIEARINLSKKMQIATEYIRFLRFIFKKKHFWIND
jgi:hypothetical protein